MTSLSLALLILALELAAAAVLALLFGERIRARLFKRRGTSRTFNHPAEAQTPDLARGLIALNQRLAQPVTPVNDSDPRPAARAAAQQAFARAAQALGREGVCDTAFAMELLNGCDRLIAALDQLPVVRETVVVKPKPSEADMGGRRQSFLKTLMMEKEGQANNAPQMAAAYTEAQEGPQAPADEPETDEQEPEQDLNTTDPLAFAQMPQS